MDVKQRSAKYASQFVKDGMIVGLGGGRTIQHLANYIKDMDVKVVTPSKNTALNCKSIGINVIPTYLVNHVDVAFDGCDEADASFHALKSGGGIHTAEKIIGSMADHYMLVIDETKFSEQLTYIHPVVVEIIPDAYANVCKKITDMGYSYVNRTASNKDGIIISDFGNIIIDVQIQEYVDPELLYNQLISLVGVVEISIFTKEVTDLIIATDSDIKHLKK